MTSDSSTVAPASRLGAGVQPERLGTVAVHVALGDDTSDALVARGAAMTYDEIVEYTLHHLEPPDAAPD